MDLAIHVIRKIEDFISFIKTDCSTDEICNLWRFHMGDNLMERVQAGDASGKIICRFGAAEFKKNIKKESASIIY